MAQRWMKPNIYTVADWLAPSSGVVVDHQIDRAAATTKYVILRIRHIFDQKKSEYVMLRIRYILDQKKSD